MKRGRLLAALILAALALLSYYGVREFNPVTGETQHIAITKDQEIALGLQSAPQMAAQFGGEDEDPELRAFVAAVGQRVAQNSIAGKTGYQFSFTLLRDTETVNAFALPGGPIFITRALLQQLPDEAALAGVLGHEVGHVIARHSAEHIARSQLAQGLIGAAGVAGSGGDDGGRSTAQIAAFVAQMAQLKYGRSDEIQSDTLGVRLMAEAGYDPRALIDVMDVLERAAGSNRPPEYLSSHPDPGNRKGRIEAAIEAHFPNGVPSQLSRGLKFQTRS